MLFLEPLVSHHLDELLNFELRNRQFFEQHINARPASYYCEAGVTTAIAQAVRDAESDAAYQYLIRDLAGTLVGRANLTRVRRAHFHSAELGYRVAEEAGGKGYATEAVRRVIGEAFGEHRLKRLEATVRPENEGSVKVLTRNGFSKFGQSTKSFELAGRWYDLLHFELRADA
jgi:[ribosomal protein S5]-alanine N-acetyltransferase